MRVQWFHAVDIAKRRPNVTEPTKSDKPPPVPKKYAAFTKTDSKALEAAWQGLVEEDERVGYPPPLEPQPGGAHHARSDSRATKTKDPGRIKVPVNEDYLFDVDVERRELGPAYWLGPIYDVRRGTWFYQEGSVQKPCDEKLAAQLEEGYLKVKPWLPQETRARSQSVSQSRTRPTSWAPDAVAASRAAKELSSKGSDSNLKVSAERHDTRQTVTEADQASDNTYRLFGSHMNSVVTYSDATTAWLSTEDFLSKINYNMYQRFGGGGHFGGVKLSRGFNYAVKKVEEKEAKPDDNSLKVSVSDGDKTAHGGDLEDPASPRTPAENRRQTLERHMSYLLEDPNTRNPARQDEEQRMRDEQEIEDDYREADNEDQGRPIEHLILVTHGIGQRLGLRLESVNFVHDVNMLRKTLKAVYSDSPDLRALNAELDSTSKVNSRVQVLPICWRHLLDFPKHSLKKDRSEHDIADPGQAEHEEYPSLSDISVEGVPAVRNLISDLALDILLYQSPAYKDHISRIVLEECNRIYGLFIERNPDFRGKVSMIGHSLGSAIMFDLLCRQGGQGVAIDKRSSHGHKGHMKLDFKVADFYALGSPIGLFQMLKGEGIAARSSTAGMLGSSLDDPMLDSHPSARPFARDASDAHAGDFQYSQPQCDQIFNIFHPTDPIAYRLEPLISKAMSSLKPQPLPYTKRGIFGAPVGQGLTGIGARVGQSVSSFWSSMSSGLASSLLVRGLGYAEDPQSKSGPLDAKDAKSNAPLSLGAGTMPPNKTKAAQAIAEAANADIKQAQLATDALAAGAKGQHPPTLIDQDIETLSSGYEKRQKSLSSDSNTRDLGATHADLAEIEERGKRLKREEEKVRKLNSNGRVDYAIQEGAFDINLLAAIASHLSYWGDEDVSHFMISQLLSRHQNERSGHHRVRSRSGR
ncbi:hypothetical protein AMS68_004271 [Peltaster fructicola]|uniref:DDHD domain-containing protein n=1 Tax=Peltaster fructicola TaxID=286661 RepID=A0A6H0XVK0_9PEZI|nr:hypothetical protein AMS68_004271 [Peltaster fructicola]